MIRITKTSHDHICAECGAIYPCPDPNQRPCMIAEERIGLCPQCEPEEDETLLVMCQ